MKDFIVLVGMIILGIAIFVVVIGFRDDAESLGDNVETQLGNMTIPTVPTTP